jgi:hypothetical protein
MGRPWPTPHRRLGWNRHGANQALYLRHWSERVTLLSHGRDFDLDRRADCAGAQRHCAHATGGSRASRVTAAT